MTMYGGNMYQTAAPGIYATNPGMNAGPMMTQPTFAGGGGFQTMVPPAGGTATNSYADVFPVPQGNHRAYEPLATSEHRTRERAKESCLGRCCHVYTNSRPRLCLLITCLVALIFPVILLVTSTNARNEPSFALYSELSVANASSDFSTLMLILALFAVIAMIVALVGVAVSSNENLGTIRGFVVSALVCSLLLMIFGLYIFFVNNSSMPAVVRTANEICQAQTSTSAAWACAAPVNGAAAPAVAAGVPAAAAHGGAAVWLTSRDPSVSTTGCSELASLCITPPNIPAENACACSGQSAVAWTQVPIPAATGRLAGAYCDNWGNDTSAALGPMTPTEWCFVSQYVACGQITLDSATGYLRSNGPCADTVDSRSQAVYDGASLVQTACLWTAVVGLVLLVASWVGLWVHSSPGTNGAHMATRGLAGAGHAPTQDVSARFDQAQRDAVTRINASTPENVKLEIYGFYKQAKDGDATGTRPGLLNQLERRKYDAWVRHRGMPREEAMMHYCSAVDLV